jgi:protein disulfide-isomerase
MKQLGLVMIIGLALLLACSAPEPAWLSDFDKAQAIAKEQGKLVFIDFTGSDWCPPCMKLHHRVLTSKEFTRFAEENLVMLLVDFPHGRKLSPDQQKANDALVTRFGVNGFPTIIVLDSNGKQLSREDGYDGASAREFVSGLEKLKQ